MQNPTQNRFDALIAPHLTMLFRMAYRLVRNTADAQDLVQDTCVTACGNLDGLASADSPLRWLLRIQHNRFIDLHRRRDRSPLVAAADAGGTDSIESELPGPEQVMQQFQDEQLLERAFLQLEPTQRTLLSLRAEGYELPEIEAITGVERGVLSARLHRARVRLAQLLNEGNHGAAVRRIGSRK
jgi:RNA polymerase sigma-70 factor (ECF subfamily)